MSGISYTMSMFPESATFGNKDIPRWLFEFHLEGIKTNKSNANENRPASEDSLANRPKWFEELSKKRRMSDIGRLNFKMDSPKIEIKTKYDDSDDSEERKSSDISESKSLDDPFSSPSISFSPEVRNAQRLLNESSPYYEDILTIHDDDDDNVNSTFKQIENLKLDGLITTIEEEECVIPEMPTGDKLSLILIENWGDPNFIGLNGIEILDQFGKQPKIKKIYLDDGSQNGSMSTTNDLEKLMDNVYRTHDDAHLWQYRIEQKGLPLKIVILFERPITIALIRIWNYNKSRIHSYRGVKFCNIKLNDTTIFCGEIAKASGDLSGSFENFGDTILFTTNEEVLERISHYDVSFQELLMEQLN